MSKYSHFEMCEKIFGQKYKWNEQKHDYEPYSRTDMWNKMIEQQDKISDLEAKLAESEKKAYSRGHSQRDIANEIKLNALREDVANKEKRIVELKQQLAECEKSKESYRLQNEQHHLQLLQFYSRLGVEAFGADIHEKALETLMIMKEQLAESEKNFIIANNLRKNSDEVLLNYKTKKYGLDKTIEELRKMKLSLPEKEWYYKGFENCERQMSSHIADLTLEVKQLKQQLHDLPKKIVRD